MKTLAISAKLRKGTGKADSKALRNQGNVPCVLYGGEKQVCFYAHENDFRNLVYTPDVFIIELDIEGQKYKAVMQDLQFHPVTDKILHIDFFQLHEGKEINMIIPVRIEGTAPGVRDSGGLLSRNKRKLTVRALPKNLPDFLLADVSKLNLNDSITVADLADETFKILHPDSQVVCQVKMSRASMSIDEDIDDEELEEGETSESADASGDSKPSEAGDTSKSDEGKSNDKKDEKSDNN